MPMTRADTYDDIRREIEEVWEGWLMRPVPTDTYQMYEPY
jgi:predicted RNase H-like HicB family nuclease